MNFNMPRILLFSSINMKRQLNFLALLVIGLFFNCNTFAQSKQFTAGINLGYNSYTLGQLSDFENILSEDYNWPVPLDAVEEFPNFYSYGLSFSMRTGRINTSIRYSLFSTGSRYHYADYSGEIGFDTLLKANVIDLSGTFLLLPDQVSSKARLYGGIAPGFSWGTYGLTEYLRLDESQTQNDLDFTHRGVSSELFILAERSFGRMILSLRGGYNFSIYSRVYREGEEITLPGTEPERSTNADLSGFRTGIGVEYKLW